jgi:hypothetical protein
MVQTIAKMLETAEVAEPQSVGALQAFGLRWKNGHRLVYHTLDEALAAGSLEISEASESGTVSTLRVVNKADALVFLMAGEQLIGAKQNRVLNTSLMVAGKTTLPVPVSCVEAGRWGYRSPHFSSPGTMAHGALRYFMAKTVGESYKRGGRGASDQGGVWSEVSRKLTSMGSASPTHALHQAYEDYRQRLEDFRKQLTLAPDCQGVAFVIRGTVAGIDVFDQPGTLAKLWPKVLGSYAMEAFEHQDPAAPVEVETVRQWLRSAAQANEELFKSPGLGDDVRLQGSGVVGAGLLVDGHPVHVELFSRN